MSDIFLTLEDHRGECIELGKSGTISTSGLIHLDPDQMIELATALLRRSMTLRYRVTERMNAGSES